jgi:general secretion pathway protein D
VIEDLDVLRKQVYVDAVILELSSIDGLDLSTAYHAPFSPSGESVGFMGGQFGTSSLGLTDDLLSGLAFGVFGQTIDVPLADGTVLPVPTFGVALTALKTNQMVNIVSNPSLLTLDNEKAKIVVGRKIPFPTTSGLNNLGQPVVSFQREDVAITLELVPRVNSENFVTLEVDIEVQEIEESADSDAISQGGGGFITSKRQVKTHALVKDNQTVVLGGLVGTTESEGESKVPILGDLPLIGALFRNRSESSRKVNLMVFLTPHIIDDENDMLEIMRVKEAQRQEFFRRFYGKNQSEQVDEMRRLLQYSMNYVDQPSVFRGSTAVSSELTLDGMEISDETREVLQQQLDLTEPIEPGSGAGQLPSSDLTIDDGLFIIEDAPEAELPMESEGETPAAGELVDETLDTPSEGEE